MREAEYRAMFEMEEHLWWYVGMRAITATLLTEHLPSDSPLRWLDVGCGTGYSLRWLKTRFNLITSAGVDFSPHATEFWQANGLRQAARGSATQLPFAANSFDVVTCFDVIYQFSTGDANRSLGEFQRVLQPGGLLFIREPAYDWMRGAHDEAVSTQHRFRLGELSRMIQLQGFGVCRQTYANMVLLPLALAHRWGSKRGGQQDSDVRPIHPLLNRFFRQVLEAEARLLKNLRFPCGLSAIVIARKNGD